MDVSILVGFFTIVGQMVAVLYGVFFQGLSYFHLVELLDMFKAIKGTDFAAMVAQMKTLTDEGRAQVEAGFMHALPMALASKLQPFESYAEKVIMFAEKMVNFGMSSYQEGMALVAEFKTLFGIV